MGGKKHTHTSKTHNSVVCLWHGRAARVTIEKLINWITPVTSESHQGARTSTTEEESNASAITYRSPLFRENGPANADKERCVDVVIPSFCFLAEAEGLSSDTFIAFDLSDTKEECCLFFLSESAPEWVWTWNFRPLRCKGVQESMATGSSSQGIFYDGVFLRLSSANINPRFTAVVRKIRNNSVLPFEAQRSILNAKCWSEFCSIPEGRGFEWKSLSSQSSLPQKKKLPGPGGFKPFGALGLLLCGVLFFADVQGLVKVCAFGKPRETPRPLSLVFLF